MKKSEPVNLLLLPIKWCLGWVLMMIGITYWLVYLLLPLGILIVIGFMTGLLPLVDLLPQTDEISMLVLTGILMFTSGWFMTRTFPNPYPKWLGDWYSKMNKWVDF